MPIRPFDTLPRERNDTERTDSVSSPARFSQILDPGTGEPAGAYAREWLDPLPNDLTRMLYLASLRDCNTGCYLHPQLSRRIGTQPADETLRNSHEQVFRRLLLSSTSAYVQQLEEYIHYTGMNKRSVLQTWQSLKAYRATVPMCTLPIYCELFCLNVELALSILSAAREKDTTGAQDAISFSR